MKRKRSLVFLAVILLCLCFTAAFLPGCGKEKAEWKPITSPEELAGKKIGMLTGTIFDELLTKYYPESEIVYAEAHSDLIAMLAAGKIDAYIEDEPIARSLMMQEPKQKVLTLLQEDHYAFAFPKIAGDTEKARKLCEEVNAFLQKAAADGTLDELDGIWFGTDENRKAVDLPTTGEKLTLAINSTSEPLSYVKGNAFVGYEIDLAARFCREYGYALETVDYNFSGMLSAVSGGKCDFAASAISVTEERKQSILFSDVTYEAGVVIVVPEEAPMIDSKGFFASIPESFEKTFLKEDRYKLFLNGIGTTLAITLAAAVLGLLLGFLLYLPAYRENRIYNGVLTVFVDIFSKMPTVIVLMILYYVVFGASDLSGFVISVIGFTLLFAFSTADLLRSGVHSVDKGQREVGLALGYTERRTFFSIVLPQARGIVLPGMQNDLISLIKETAIVGYIAVQDLTKVSDIVRGRTFEPFFSLIASALIYFLLATLLELLVLHIGKVTNSRHRSPAKILKGVKTK